MLSTCLSTLKKGLDLTMFCFLGVFHEFKDFDPISSEKGLMFLHLNVPIFSFIIILLGVKNGVMNRNAYDMEPVSQRPI